MEKYFIFLFMSNFLLSSHWSGQDYSQNNQAQQQWFNDFVQLEIQGNEKILDIGCGDGKNTVEVAKQLTAGGFILGIDKSADMIEFAKKSLLNESSILADKISFQESDVLDFIDTESYDLIVSFSVLHWIKEQKNVFTTVKNCLKKNGRFYCIFSTNFESSFTQFNLAKNQTLAFYKNLPIELGAYTYTKEYYEEGLKQLGFKAKIKITNKKNVFANKKEFSNWLTQWIFNYFVGVPEYKKKSFLKKFIKNYKNQEQTFDVNTKQINWYGFIMIIDAIKE